MVNTGDAEEIFRLFSAALTEGISACAQAFNDENSIRDFISKVYRQGNYSGGRR